MTEGNLTTLLVDKEVAQRLRDYCNSNGLKIGFVSNKIVSDFLDEVENVKK